MFRRSGILSSLAGLLLLFSASGCPSSPSTDTGVVRMEAESRDFGEVWLGQRSVEQTYVIHNDATINVEGIWVDVAAPFEVTSTTCRGKLGVGESCEVRLTFVPMQAGPVDARLVLYGIASPSEVRVRGTGVAELKIGALPSGVTRIGDAAGEWFCTEACTREIRQAEVTLQAESTELPDWSDACVVGPDPTTCTVSMDGAKEVSVSKVSPRLKAELHTRLPLRDLAVAPNGDLVLVDEEAITRLTPQLEVRWSVAERDVSDIGLDGRGDVYAVNAQAQVFKLGAHGEVLWRWSHERPGAPGSQYTLEVSPRGEVVVLFDFIEESQTPQRKQLAFLSSRGEVRWLKALWKGPIATPFSLAIRDHASIYVGGVFLPEEGTLQSLVLKFDEKGQKSWEVNASAVALAVEPTGQVIATSTIREELDADEVVTGYTHTLIGADGAVRGHLDFKEPRRQVLRSIVAPDGKLVVAGEVEKSDGTSVPWFGALHPGQALEVVGHDVSVQSDRTSFAAFAVSPEGEVVMGLSVEVGGKTEGHLQIFDPRVIGVGSGQPR